MQALTVLCEKVASLIASLVNAEKVNGTSKNEFVTIQQRLRRIWWSFLRMNPSVADRKLAWLLPATVSVAVVAAMLLFPYATGYGLRSDPLAPAPDVVEWL